MQDKIEAHEAFWRGEGPSLILIPAEDDALYDTDDYARRFDDPGAMWESEMRRAQLLVDWPTDGIPTVRPNLGVVFVPAIAGLGYEIHAGQMPWPGEPLGRDAIRAARLVDVAAGAMTRRAEAFYAIHRERAPRGADARPLVAPYHPDTQGVFDVAHLLAGDAVLYAVSEEPGWVAELLEICVDLCVRVSRRVKELLDEPAGTMIHGHGAPQGVYFPDCGVRMAEDTATLLSPSLIEQLVLPAIERASEPFGGTFVHFCGRHEAFLEMLCHMPAVRAIDLGNPEMWDSLRVLERCAQTGTVLHSRLAARDGETWETYLCRLGVLVRETGARCILRPVVFPSGRAECAAMRDLWHELTS